MLLPICRRRMLRGSARRWYSARTVNALEQFKQLCSQEPSKADLPLASSINARIPIYDAAHFDVTDSKSISTLRNELQKVLHHGPGVYILKHVYPHDGLIERVNDVFARIIDRESGSFKGDHFAAAGKNARIWNSFGKHALEDPTTFAQYYSNPWLRIVSESWLGPACRITAQCNIVKPGGSPQQPHRDYHLGFQTAEAVAQFPLATQIASQFLTLQGAVAHSDMPLESGPTRFLPYSQTYPEGYAAYRDPSFQDYFHQSWMSLPLEQGDAVFFSPALFHAAGENQTTNVERSANLLQVSSAFGKTMESIDSIALVSACWNDLQSMFRTEGMQDAVENLIRAVAEGYPFPTNLDRRPPAQGGMAPENEQSLLRRMLKDGAHAEDVVATLRQIHSDSSM